MGLTQFYYDLKPFLPRLVRDTLRRWSVKRRLNRCRAVWPISETSGLVPPGWPGWPYGKKFALILTHDVEGHMGLERCRKLMELEMRLGFRSSFNFVPEGEYRVPAQLREELQRNGFEVGVHDLNHDGKLYRTKRQFHQRASRINKYLREWGAVGFRSAYMMHRLDWLHELDVLYDASTFDTDPFEPQPDGCNTIFPFWVPGGSCKGYVELPYTLPQDSTLFLHLREATEGIWRRKLDWLAEKGGMVLVNVHPDYLRLPEEPSSDITFPIEFYARFLEYISQGYNGAYWHCLPKEVAAYVASFRMPLVPRKPRRVCMVTHSIYESDNRVMRYAEALVERGDQVDVLALRGSPDIPRHESINGINVFRIQTREAKTEQGKLGYLLPVVRFLVVSSTWIIRHDTRHRYDLFHIHNVPDFLVFSSWYPRLRGTKVILDIHDIVPEFFASKFGVPLHSRFVRYLLLVERACAKFSDHVIIANHLWLEKYVKRSAPPEKCSAFINNVDAGIFYPRPRGCNNGKIVVIFPGGLQWHQGVDIAIHAFGKIIQTLPKAEFHIYGDGNMKAKLVALAHDLGLDAKVRFFAPLRLRQVSEVMAKADLGVVPKRADSFGNEAYSTKILEFMSLGVPVVASSTKIDRYYFDDSVVRFFESGNVDALAEAMLEVLLNDDIRQQLIKSAAEYVGRNNWDSRKTDYLALVDRLCHSRTANS